MRSILNPIALTIIALWIMTVDGGATDFTTIYDLPWNIAFPYGRLVLSSNTLYGTTMGGSGDSGTVFRIHTDGTFFTVLHNFSEETSETNRDGAEPFAGLTLSGNTLYGVAYRGGIYGYGTLFKINTDGTGFTLLHQFNSDTGAYPCGELVLSSNTLYGTTRGSVISGPEGTVFKINTDGTGFTNLHNFSGSDGAGARGALVLSDSVLYGITEDGGSGFNGTIFRVNIDGTGFTNLWNFNGANGAYPVDGLILSGNTLFGTTSQGGQVGNAIPPGAVGTIFRLNIDGTGFTNLHYFITTNLIPIGSSFSSVTNSDGVWPMARLALAGNTLYGTTYLGGTNGTGVIFKINTGGAGFANLFNFNEATGLAPTAGLVISGDVAYGTTIIGGTGLGSGGGTLFALTLVGSIPLQSRLAGGALVLNWSDPTFTLQASPAITGVYSNVPGATSPYTNAITDSQMFFRLKAKSQ